MDLILLFFIIFIFFSISKNTGLVTHTLTAKVTTNIQCVLIFFVIFHHLNQGLRGVSGTLLSTSLSIVGRLSVGLFFFLSGYGLIKQLLLKKDIYLKSFLSKRLLPVLGSFSVALIIYFFYFNIISTISLKTSLYNLLLGSPVVSNGWYATAILIFYLLFFISGRITNNMNIMMLVLFLGTFAIIYFERKFNYGEWTYNALICFPVGALWSYKEKNITEVLFKNYKINCALNAILFSSFFYLDEVKPMLIFRSLSCVFFALTVILISYRVTIHSPIFSVIKLCLFEIYLYHGLFISLFYSRINSRLIYCLFVIIVSILFSWILKKSQKVGLSMTRTVLTNIIKKDTQT